MISPKSLAPEITTYCNLSKIEELLKVNESSLEAKLEDLSLLKFTGIARHTFREEGISSSQYFIFKDGRIVAIIKEENISSPSPGYSFLTKPILKEGALEVLLGPKERLENIAKRLNGSSPELEMYSHIEIPQEVQQPFQAPAPVTEVEVSSQPQISSAHIKQPVEPEKEVSLNREELLKKLNLKEPDEDFVDEVLEKYKEDAPVSKAKCEAALLTIKSEIAKVFGEKKAEKIIQGKIDTLGINPKRATLKELEKLVDAIYNTTFKSMVGGAKAKSASEALKKKIKEITS